MLLDCRRVFEDDARESADGGGFDGVGGAGCETSEEWGCEDWEGRPQEGVGCVLEGAGEGREGVCGCLRVVCSNGGGEGGDDEGEETLFVKGVDYAVVFFCEKVVGCEEGTEEVGG